MSSNDDDFLNEKMPNEEATKTDEFEKNQQNIDRLTYLMERRKKKYGVKINQSSEDHEASNNNDENFAKFNVYENNQNPQNNQPPIVNQVVNQAVNQAVAVNQPVSPVPVNQAVSPAPVNQAVSPVPVNQAVSPVPVDQEYDPPKRYNLFITVKFFQLTPKHVEFLTNDDIKLLNKVSIVLFLIYIFIFLLFYNLNDLIFRETKDSIALISYFIILLCSSYITAYFFKMRFIRKINHIDLEEHR